jgi:hypothetical protein
MPFGKCAKGVNVAVLRGRDAPSFPPSQQWSCLCVCPLESCPWANMTQTNDQLRTGSDPKAQRESQEPSTTCAAVVSGTSIPVSGLKKLCKGGRVDHGMWFVRSANTAIFSVLLRAPHDVLYTVCGSFTLKDLSLLACVCAALADIVHAFVSKLDHIPFQTDVTATQARYVLKHFKSFPRMPSVTSGVISEHLLRRLYARWPVRMILDWRRSTCGSISRMVRNVSFGSLRRLLEVHLTISDKYDRPMFVELPPLQLRRLDIDVLEGGPPLELILSNWRMKTWLTDCAYIRGPIINVADLVARLPSARSSLTLIGTEPPVLQHRGICVRTAMLWLAEQQLDHIHLDNCFDICCPECVVGDMMAWAIRRAHQLSPQRKSRYMWLDVATVDMVDAVMETEKTILSTRMFEDERGRFYHKDPFYENVRVRGWKPAAETSES